MSPPASIAELAAAIQQQIRAAGTAERAVQEKRYLKGDLDFFGAAVPSVRTAVRAALRANPDLDRPALLALVEALWAHPLQDRLPILMLTWLPTRTTLLPPSASSG